jgi:hypothetical protein
MGLSLAPRLGAALDQTAHRLLGVSSASPGGKGAGPCVGGVVRDAVRGEIPDDRRDLDVVVEGDGLAVACLLAAETGGKLVEHRRFLTPMVDPGAPGRCRHGTRRIVRGAEPCPMCARRRSTATCAVDFTVNAMAAELSSESFCLVDPLGGRRDVQSGDCGCCIRCPSWRIPPACSAPRGTRFASASVPIRGRRNAGGLPSSWLRSIRSQELGSWPS